MSEVLPCTIIKFKQGIELLKKILTPTRVRIERITPLQNREAYLFLFMRGENGHEIFISNEFLSDLAGTKEYQRSATQYFRDLESRLLNISPSDFYSVSGVPVRVEIDWPFQALPNRDASAVQVHAYDLRKPDAITILGIYMTGQQRDFELMADSFLKERCVVNTVRKSLDSNELKFFARKEHPTELPLIKIETSNKAAENEESLNEFILGKVL